MFKTDKEKLTKEDLDMSCNICTLYTDEEDMIVFIEHNYGPFTNANKNQVLFLISLLDIKITNFEIMAK